MDDIIIFPDETWCFRSELHPNFQLTGDHTLVEEGEDLWNDIVAEHSIKEASRYAAN